MVLSAIDPVGLLSLGITIAFGILSVYFYLKARQFKQITFTYTIETLQTKTHPQVTILYQNQPVENLSRMLVACWNNGSQEIRDSDLPKERFPSIGIENGKLFSVASLLSASDFTKATVSKVAPTTVEFNFEFLNANDGVVAEILFERGSDTRLVFEAPVVGGRPSVARYHLGESGRKSAAWLGTIMSFAAGINIYVAWSSISVPGLTSPRFVGSALGTAIAVAVSLTLLGSELRHIVNNQLPRFARPYFQGRAA